jgi:serine/threonine protein kinase
MKVMNKNYIIKRKYLHYVVSEFEIMKTLAGFPFILDLHYVFQSANYLYMIFDYCPNGDFTNLAKIHNLKLFLAEIILAFEYIHSHNIVYRDLKPENILLDETGHIRVCDFNLAKAGITKDMRANSLCGSPMYFSPELLLKKGVDYKTDIYGMGLLLYEIVTGTPAYNAPNTKVLYELIKNNTIDFDVPGLIGDIKDLIEKMLVKEPNERITLDEMKKHNFLKDIDFDKVLRKEYGTIEIQKNGEMIEKISKINEESKEKMEYEKFKLLQKKMDENKEYTVLDGKITVKEMFLDQKRVMKNFVKDFYYVKQEDIEQTKDFQIQVSSKFDFSSIIIDQYEFDP